MKRPRWRCNMPRPCKKRRICFLPRCRRFVPESLSENERVVYMTVDEYECIRLLDKERLTQAECAAQMEIARTTVQAVYDSARYKLALCLTDGCTLAIEGGSYEVCREIEAPEAEGKCPRYCCPIPRHKTVKESKDMRIAVTYENGQIFQHFGHTAEFKLYDIAEGRIAKAEVLDTEGSGHGALAQWLKNHEVDALICGGIGAGAQNALAAAGIKLYGGVQGEADEAVSALLAGTLNYNAAVCCSHHDHGHHSCGEHSCH